MSLARHDAWEERRVERGTSLSDSLVQAQSAHLAGDRVDLVVVVAIHFFAQDSSHLFQPTPFLQCESANDAVPRPSLGPLQLALA